ncbi:MAG: hypothetical protein K6T78_09120 [Alicyclobacillus sp.]|nr:hypothetical protein [Alicyclobacillus sp.]
MWWALVGLGALLFGYALGRRVGFRQGCRRGTAEAPLRLRHQALRSGRCPICDRAPNAWYNGR